MHKRAAHIIRIVEILADAGLAALATAFPPAAFTIGLLMVMMALTGESLDWMADEAEIWWRPPGNSQCVAYSVGVSTVPVRMSQDPGAAPSIMSALDVFDDCLCQAVTDAAGPLGLGVGELCMTDSDRTAADCAADPYGPDDGPRPECQQSLRVSMRQSVEAAMQRRLCMRMQCAADQLGLVDSAQGQQCACIGANAAESLTWRPRACTAMQCQEGDECVCNGPACGCAHHSDIFERPTFVDTPLTP